MGVSISVYYTVFYGSLFANVCKTLAKELQIKEGKEVHMLK